MVKRIGIVSTSVIPVGGQHYGGIEKLAYDFAEELTILGYDVTMAAPIGSRFPKGVEGVNTVQLPWQQDRDDFAFLNYLPHFQKLDVVHDFSHTQVYGQRTDKPSVGIMWDPIVQKYPKADHNMVCLSNWQRERFNVLYAPQKAIVQPTICANEDKYTRGNEVVDRFLIAGKMSPDKAILEAIHLCKTAGLAADVVGSGLPTDDPAYKHQVMRECDGEQIVFWGDAAEPVKIQLLQRSKAVLNLRKQPEAHWHFGIEAMLAGTPVITYAHSAYPEVVDNGVTGFLCKDDMEVLTSLNQVDTLDRDVVREMALKYSRSRVVGDYVGLYEEVAKGRKW